MKKVILIYFAFIIACFALPSILTQQLLPTNNDAIQEKKRYDYKKFNTIKLLHTKDNSIEEIPLDDYLYGVVSAEMPASFEIEALKAQAIVARTYTIYKAKTDGGKHGDATICDDSNCCQAWISKEDRLSKWDKGKAEEYWNKIVTCVDATKGKIITYEGEPINAFFHSNSGGTTEIPFNVWGGSGYPYLQTVETSGENAYSQYSSKVTLTREEIIEKLKQNHPEAEIDFNQENAISILEHTDSGRIKTIKFGNVVLSGVEARKLFGLKSANFEVTINENNVEFNVIGYGHGVGMSQTGADSMAKEGKTCEEIIKHFYTGVEIIEY